MSTARFNTLSTLDNSVSIQVEDLAGLSVNDDITKGAASIGYRGRTVYDKLEDAPSLQDYPDLATAKAAAGTREVHDRNGVTYKDVFNLDGAVFTETTDPLWKMSHVTRQFSNGTHIGGTRTARGFELRPEGSGANGPTNADYVMSLSNIKQDWFNTTKVGELDVLNITFRQGGRLTDGVNSDAAGILINGGGVDDTGWYAFAEGQISIFDPVTAAVTRQVQVGMGVLDSVTKNYYGYTATANVGTLNAAFFANQMSGGAWSNFLQYLGDSNVELFKVDNSGRIVLRAGTGPTPSKTIRALSGSLSILDHAQTTQIFQLTDAGAIDVPSSVAGAGFAAKGAAFSAGPSAIVYGGTTAPTANAGGVGSLPATVQGYIIINVQGTQCKVPFYAN